MCQPIHMNGQEKSITIHKIEDIKPYGCAHTPIAIKKVEHK